MEGNASRTGQPPTQGGFNNPDAHRQCTAISKRSRERCKGPACLGSDKCRMHGGTMMREQGGARNHGFTNGRHSRVLKEGTRLHDLYHDALSVPDLTDMSDHLALLEGKMQEVLEKAGDDPVPEWREFVWAVDQLADAVASGDGKKIGEMSAALTSIVRDGARWDSSWSQVVDTLDHIRKLADTEVKRKKDLGQMIPVERVVALMAAVGHAVKANVTNASEIQAVYRELARLHGLPMSAGNLRPGDVVDVVVGEVNDELEDELAEARKTLPAVPMRYVDQEGNTTWANGHNKGVTFGDFGDD